MVGGLAAAAALAAPAAASYKGVCTMNADAKTIDKADPTIGLRLVGGEGKYTFNTLAVFCLADTNKDGIPEVDQIQITADGWYSFTVCGTGKLVGTVDDVTADYPKTEVLLEGRKFAMQFVDGSGTFKWHDPTAKPLLRLDKEDPPSEDKPDNAGDKDYTAAGYVQMGEPHAKPGLPNVSAGECMKAFSVTGSMLIHFDS